MNPTQYSFKTKDGLSLFARAWISPENNPKGKIYLVHGLGEHSGRYDHVGNALAKAGYHLAGFDLRGHGLSEGPRGHSPGLNHLMDDIQVFIKTTNQHLGNHKPTFLYGHSLGGNLAMYFGLQNPKAFRGAIVTSPALETAKPQPKAKVAFATIMAKVAPTLTLNNGIKTEGLSRNVSVVKAYQNDVYVHNKISARMGVDLLESGKTVRENAGQWLLPLLLMHGSADPITSPTASGTFAKKANYTVDFILWDGYYHELHNDLGSEKVLQTMINWLDQNTLSSLS
jgi:alpha-beta hydrolase superfamily lysophospholipase